MSLLDSLQKDMVAAMKAKDKNRLKTVRMLKAAIQNEQISVGHDLTPDEEVGVLSRELKQRKDLLKNRKLLDVTIQSKNLRAKSQLCKAICLLNWARTM